MPQKIDIHGLFIDPETITDLMLQKRISIYYPVFREVEAPKSFFVRFDSSQPRKHLLEFDHQEPYGIILADAEQPDPSNYVVNFKEASLQKLLKGFGRAGKSIAGHITEMLNIEVSGDREYRILQPGRIVKQTSIREIPAKARLLSGQWVDVFSSSPDYDFQGGTPYAVTDVASCVLMILTKEYNYALYGAGVDVSNEEIASTYRALAETYNQIQKRRDSGIEEKGKKSSLKIPQIDIQMPKIDMPQIKIPAPISFGKKKADDFETPDDTEILANEEMTAEEQRILEHEDEDQS